MLAIQTNSQVIFKCIFSSPYQFQTPSWWRENKKNAQYISSQITFFLFPDFLKKDNFCLFLSCHRKTIERNNIKSYLIFILKVKWNIFLHVSFIENGKIIGKIKYVSNFFYRNYPPKFLSTQHKFRHTNFRTDFRAAKKSMYVLFFLTHLGYHIKSLCL
jgi:hypothetical protein